MDFPILKKIPLFYGILYGKRGNPPDGSVYHEGDPGPAAAPYRPAQPQNRPLRLALRPDLLFPEPQSGLCLYRRHLRHGSGYGPLQAPRRKPPVRHRYRRFPRHRALPDLPGLLSRRGTPPAAGAPALRRYRRPDSAGPDLLGRRRTARWGGALPAAVLHRPGRLHLLLSQPHAGHRRGGGHVPAHQRSAPPGAAGRLAGKARRPAEPERGGPLRAAAPTKPAPSGHSTRTAGPPPPGPRRG